MNASIRQAGDIACTSCIVSGYVVTASATLYSPYYCCGRVNSEGADAADAGSVGFTSSRLSTGVHVITHNTAYPSTS